MLTPLEARASDEDELPVRRPMLAAGPPEILAGEGEPGPADVHGAAVSAAEALRLYRTSLASEHKNEAFVSKVARVTQREAEARAALQWLGGLFEAAGDNDAAWRCRRMAHLLVSDHELDMRDVETWEAWLREAAEGQLRWW